MSVSSDLHWKDPDLLTYPGNPFPLGAAYDGHGINFALYSEHATKVFLCLFRPYHHDQSNLVEYQRIPIRGKGFPSEKDKS